jgi:cysteine desulfurase
MANSGRPIYFDYHATTPVDPRVAAVVLRHMVDVFGNPSSGEHSFGAEAADAVETARAAVAALVRVPARQVVFTSGATESLNWALRLAAARAQELGRLCHLAVGVTEHAAVLEPCRALVREGKATLTRLPVSDTGQVDLDAVRDACVTGADLVVVMAANNEVGTVAPLEALLSICRTHEVEFLCDASQAVGKVPLNWSADGPDLAAVSGHKLYAPKGVGVLLARAPDRLRPLLHGGGQERGARSGTLNVPGIVGLGEACRLCLEAEQIESVAIAARRDRLQSLLVEGIPGLRVNGDLGQRLPGSLHISLLGTPAEAVVARLQAEVALSTGSACASGAVGPSHVLRALGWSDDRMEGALRIGIGRFTTDEEIARGGELIVRAAAQVGQAMAAP